MSPTKRKSIPVTTYFITLIGQPHCNGHFCWQASLLHLPVEFQQYQDDYQDDLRARFETGNYPSLLSNSQCDARSEDQIHHTVSIFSTVNCYLSCAYILSNPHSSRNLAQTSMQRLDFPRSSGFFDMRGVGKQISV